MATFKIVSATDGTKVLTVSDCKDNKYAKHFDEGTKVEITIDGNAVTALSNPERTKYTVLKQGQRNMFTDGDFGTDLTFNTYVKPAKPAKEKKVKEPKTPKAPTTEAGGADAGVAAGTTIDKNAKYNFGGEEVLGSVLIKKHGAKTANAMLLDGRATLVGAETTEPVETAPVTTEAQPEVQSEVQSEAPAETEPTTESTDTAADATAQ